METSHKLRWLFITSSWSAITRHRLIKIKIAIIWNYDFQIQENRWLSWHMMILIIDTLTSLGKLGPHYNGSVHLSPPPFLNICIICQRRVLFRIGQHFWKLRWLWCIVNIVSGNWGIAALSESLKKQQQNRKTMVFLSMIVALLLIKNLIVGAASMNQLDCTVKYNKTLSPRI